MKHICIFGGSGFLGHAMIARLAQRAPMPEIVIVARNEGQLVATKERFPFVEIVVGDIADPWIVRRAMNNAAEVYHFAALKHVGLAEQQVRATIASNIVGTANIIETSLSVRPGVLVFVSTDKAAQVTGVYGASKFIGERLIAEAAIMNPATRYRIVRYGNVWGSTGSIITKWKPKLEKGEEVILTDPEASRFFWTVEESVDLIYESMVKEDIGPHVPTMKAVTMGTVLEACMDCYCPPGKRSPVKIIGLQPGENKVETTDGVTFSDQVPQFTKDEFIDKFLKDDPDFLPYILHMPAITREEADKLAKEITKAYTGKRKVIITNQPFTHE